MGLVKNNVCLLVSSGGNERVYLLNLDVVQFLHGLLDRWLGGLLGDSENESVVVLDRFDGAVRADGLNNDGVLVPGRLLLHALDWGDGLASKGKGLWLAEGNLGPNLLSFLGMSAFLHVFGNLFGLADRKRDVRLNDARKGAQSEQSLHLLVLSYYPP